MYSMPMNTSIRPERALLEFELMDRIRRFAAVSFVLLSVLSGCRYSLLVTQGPSNSTVLQGSQARFNCTVGEGWKGIVWFCGPAPVVTIIQTGGVFAPDSRFSAINYTGANRFTSELIISDVKITDTGWIRCNAFSDKYSEAYLSVQVNGTLQILNGSLSPIVNEWTLVACKASGWLPAPHFTWLTNNSPVNPLNYVTHPPVGSGDLQDTVSTLNITFGGNASVTCRASIEALLEPQSTTVNVTVREPPIEGGNKNYNTEVIIIAVTVSIGGLILLIIIIVIIVVCCRRKKEESSYQSQLKKPMTAQRENNLNTVSKGNAWEANRGYDAEESGNRRPLPQAASDSSSISNSFGPENKSDDGYSTEVSSAYNGAFHPGILPYSSGPGKVKHLTHV